MVDQKDAEEVVFILIDSQLQVGQSSPIAIVPHRRTRILKPPNLA